MFSQSVTIRKAIELEILELEYTSEWDGANTSHSDEEGWQEQYNINPNN